MPYVDFACSKLNKRSLRATAKKRKGKERKEKKAKAKQSKAKQKQKIEKKRKKTKKKKMKNSDTIENLVENSAMDSGGQFRKRSCCDDTVH